MSGMLISQIEPPERTDAYGLRVTPVAAEDNHAEDRLLEVSN